MKKSWKIGMLSGLLLSPAAFAIAEQPVAAQTAEENAIEYFTKLNLSSSMADYDLYTKILNEAFPAGEADPKYALMKGKLDYIKSYNEQKLQADSLKTEISKLTLTNKTLVQSYTEANEKYNALLTKLNESNTSLAAKKAAVTEPAYDKILENIDTVYSKLATELMAELIGSNNQTLLVTRGTQVTNFINSDYASTVKQLFDATTANNYANNIKAAKDAYATLTSEEKTLADNQLVEGSTTVTLKQAMTAAEANVAKAEAFDQSVSSLSSIKPDVSNEQSITLLKTQLVAIDKAYNDLTPLQKLLINPDSENVIAPFQAVLAISGEIGALKADSSKEYRDAVTSIVTKINNLNAITVGSTTIESEIVKKIIPNVEKLEEASANIEAVEKVEALITAIKGITPESAQLQKVQEAKKAYNALSSNQKKMVNNIGELTAWENAEKNAAAVDKKIAAIQISAKSDFYKRYLEAQKAFDELDALIEVPYVKNKERLSSLKEYAELVNEFNLLKVADTDYAKKVAELLQKLDGVQWTDATIDTLPGLTNEDKIQLKVTRNLLADQRLSTDKASSLVINIDNLASVKPEELIETLILYRNTYNELDSTAKKLVTNIKKLTEYEKANKAAVNVMKQIGKLDPLSANFVKNAVSARKAYDKLNDSLKALIKDSYAELEDMEKISSVMLEIDNLRKSRDILADVKKARESFSALLLEVANQPELLKLLNDEYAPKLDLAEERHKTVENVITAINQLEQNTTSSIGDSIKNIATMYKSLTSNDKKAVTNYSIFKNIEKNYKAALKVYNLIENLPAKEADNYTKKVEAALKAYQKLKPEQTKYVFNYESKLLPVVGVASLIGDIDSIKTSMKDLASYISELRKRYDALSTEEKAQVHNYNKLEAAEKALLGANHVIQLINAARPGVDNYLDALQKARDAYDLLSNDQKKQVTNYKDLQNREKLLKPILNLNDLIIKIGSQSSAKSFISNYEKAWKELDKISLQDRALLTNEKLLTETYVPLYNVMKRIESIKSSSKTFVDDVKDARAAYDALSADQKAKILNLDLLHEHEVNVQGGAYVDNLIRALKSNPPEVYVQKVLEAEEAYKNLSSANKKAVTLYDELKVELKFIKPIVQAIEAIDLLETSGSKLDAQVKKVNSILAKLTDEQYALIPNMHKYNNLGNVIQVVNLIELIKPSDKYYVGNTKAAELAYNRLSTEEKQKVTNYNKLEEAILNVAALDQITQKISELSKFSSTYVDDVNLLLEEFKKLPSALKKQVSNYKILEQAEKDIDAADKVIRTIATIEPGIRTFESKVIAARKQYEKLTEDQKTLVTNTRLLLQYERELGL